MLQGDELLPVPTDFGSSKIKHADYMFGFSALRDTKREEVQLLFDGFPHLAAQMNRVLFFRSNITGGLTDAREVFDCKLGIISDPQGMYDQAQDRDEGDPDSFSEGYQMICSDPDPDLDAALLVYNGTRYMMFTIKSIHTEEIGFIAACVGPLFTERRMTKPWFWYNTRLGIERFNIYHALVENVTIFKPWKAGIFGKPEDQLSRLNPVRLFPHDSVRWYTYEASPMRYFHAQTTALNDCLARNRYSFAFVVTLDVDEVIRIQRGPRFDLRLFLKQHFLPGASSMVIARYLFPLKCCNNHFEPETLESEESSADFFYSCTKYIMKDHDFGKTVVRPELVESITQHRVLKALPGFETSISLHPNYAHLAHVKGEAGWDIPQFCEEAKGWLQ